MQPAVDALVELLDLEELEVNLFRGRSPEGDSQRVFGGQVLGQALVAAGRTTESGVAHSFHAYFLRPGDPRSPILYRVDRTRDGRSFTTRRVTAIQHGRAIFHQEASFQQPEKGPEHQCAMPELPGPESLPAWQERMRARLPAMPEAMRSWALRDRPIDARYVTDFDPFQPRVQPPRFLLWIKVDGRLPDLEGSRATSLLHQCIAAYASDMTLLDAATMPHAISYTDQGYQIASIDHAMWFHRELRIDDWLLYEQESPVAHGARGFSTGRLYGRDGALVASVAQEGLLRPRNG